MESTTDNGGQVDEYEPDADAFDSLVDLDGASAPPPTPAEIAVAGMEPVEAAEVIAAIEHATELAETFLIAGSGTITERLDLFALLAEVVGRDGRLPTVRKTLDEHLVADLGAPQQDSRGRWYKKGRKRSSKGWRTDELRDAVNRWAFAPDRVFDEDDGELIDEIPPTAQQVGQRLWAACSVATGRSKVLREQVGIDVAEYANVEWADCVEAIDMPTIIGGLPGRESAE